MQGANIASPLLTASIQYVINVVLTVRPPHPTRPRFPADTYSSLRSCSWIVGAAARRLSSAPLA